jgi:hypothetical protein
MILSLLFAAAAVAAEFYSTAAVICKNNKSAIAPTKKIK